MPCHSALLKPRIVTRGRKARLYGTGLKLRDVAQGHRHISSQLRDIVLRARKARTDGLGSTRQRREEREEVLPEDAKEDASSSGRLEQDSATATAAPARSMSECGTLEELLAAVMRQADGMSGGEAAKGLARLVNLSRGRGHKVRGAPALSTLYAVLERSVEDLGPKVLLSCLSCKNNRGIAACGHLCTRLGLLEQPTCFHICTYALPQEISQSLWSLAKLRAKRPRLLRVLAQQVSILVDQLSARDLATAVWAFGTVQYLPDSALQRDLACASRSRFADFEPQVTPPAAFDLVCG